MASFHLIALSGRYDTGCASAFNNKVCAKLISSCCYRYLYIGFVHVDTKSLLTCFEIAIAFAYFISQCFSSKETIYHAPVSGRRLLLSRAL